MTPKSNRRLLLAAMVLLSGCAAVFPPEPTLTVNAGSTVCTAPTKAECDQLLAVAATLHTPTMNAAIADARK